MILPKETKKILKKIDYTLTGKCFEPDTTGKINENIFSGLSDKNLGKLEFLLHKIAPECTIQKFVAMLATEIQMQAQWDILNAASEDDDLDKEDVETEEDEDWDEEDEDWDEDDEDWDEDEDEDWEDDDDDVDDDDDDDVDDDVDEDEDWEDNEEVV